MNYESKTVPRQLLAEDRPYLDLSSYRRRIRWTQGTISSKSNRCEIVIPNEDCFSLNGRIRFKLNVISQGGTNEAPEFNGHSFIERIRLEIGGSKIVDLDHNALFQNVVNVATDPGRQRGNRAYDAITTAAQLIPGNREGISSFQVDLPLSTLSDSLLNHKRTVLPVFMLPRTTLTFYFADDSACTSAVGTPATYTIENLELLMTYYSSPALKQHFSSVPYSLPFTDVAHRLFSLAAGQSSFDLQIPSNFRSLRSLVCVARKNDIENDFQATNKNVTYDPLGGPGLKFNLRVNGFQLWQESIDGRDLFFDQLRRVFGNDVLHSEFFKQGTEFETDKFIMCAQLNALGGDEKHVSGARTNNHVSSLSIHIQMDTPLVENLRLDVFCLYDKLLSISGGNLQVIQ